MVTPTTLYPVSALYHWTKVPGCEDGEAELQADALRELPDTIFREVLPPPPRPDALPEDAQWLAGESAGSWFVLHSIDGRLRVWRYSRVGVLECQSDHPLGLLPLTATLQVTYPSDCSRVTVRVNGATVTLH
jgi:hypothetical protein